MRDTTYYSWAGNQQSPRAILARGIVVASLSFALLCGVVRRLPAVEGVIATQTGATFADGAIVSTWSLLAVGSPGANVVWSCGPLQSKVHARARSNVTLNLVPTAQQGAIDCRVIQAESATRVATGHLLASVSSFVVGTGTSEMQVILKPEIDLEFMTAGDYDLTLNLTISQP